MKKVLLLMISGFFLVGCSYNEKLSEPLYETETVNEEETTEQNPEKADDSVEEFSMVKHKFVNLLLHAYTIS